jgi:alpha-amylase/alpha-mannosidase (GH57 family)
LEKVSNESYRPLLKMLREHPRAKLTINICGILTEMLNEHSGQDIIALIKELAGRGQIEFVDSAKYHAILPLIPQEEMRRQIEQNHKTNMSFFRDAYNPQGFFPPELCYSDKLANFLKDMGYKWILVSGVACPDKWPLDVIYKIPFDLNVFYRDDILSNKISFHNTDSSGFISELVNLAKDKSDIYVITAMDAETFGHHIHNWEKLFLAEVYEKIENHREIKQRIDLAETHKEVVEAGKAAEVEVVTISELLKKIPEKDSKSPRPSSWSTTKEDIIKKNYYPLWKGQGNVVHGLQWEHVKICFEFIKEAFKLQDNEESRRFYDISRALLDRAIHSCQFWWANKSRGMWDINLINKGLMLQEEVVLNAYKSIRLSKANEEIKSKFYYKVVASRDVANKIRDQLFV